MQAACDVNFDYLKELQGEINGLFRIPLDEFVSTSWVADAQRDMWLDTLIANRDKIKVFPRSNTGAGKAVIMVGSSPAIKKNFHQLKDLGKDFIIVACNGIAKFLVENGIRPDYIFCVESRDHILPDFDFDTSGLTLIASPFVSPRVYDLFKGEVFTYLIGGGEKVNAELQWSFQEPIEVSGGNVMNTGFLWAYKFLSARYFIFTGMSLCFYDDYYFDGRSTEHVGQNVEGCRDAYKAVDIYGDAVSTTPVLTMYKVWLECYMKYAPKGSVFINATENGILGVYPEVVSYQDDEYRYNVRYLPWINIVPLAAAIRGFREWKEKR